MPDTAIHAFALWLSERCEFLHSLETEAGQVLQEDKDTAKYKTLMCRKAMFLQALSEEARPLVATLAPDVEQAVMERLERFSQNASRALGLDSVFYMYALLYPDNHQKGEPNDLERLTNEMLALSER